MCMKKDFEKFGKLIDAYGTLLTPHSLEIVKSYYDFDLSLAEIAENFGVTRQSAMCTVKQAEARLVEYESKLGLIEKSDKLNAALMRLSAELNENLDKAKATVRQIIDGNN